MADERDVVIVDGVRTPFVKSGGKFKDLHTTELGRAALKELIARTHIDVNKVDEVVIGNTGNPSDSANVARVVALNAGVPQHVPAVTVHRNCASALEAITDSFNRIRAGYGEVILAGGTENMSQMPLLFTKRFQDIFSEFAFAKSAGKKIAALKKLKLVDLKPRVALLEGLTDPFAEINMGQTAEILAREFKITRQEQDEFAKRSHDRVVAAMKSGRLAQEIIPVFLPPKFEDVVNEDIGPREGQSMEKLAALKPFFDRKYGTITPGNSCPITDGAAMVLMMTRKRAQELGYKPIARIVSYGFAGLEPERMGLGPVYAAPVALKRAGLTMKDMGLVEINEAFAAQVLACVKAFASKDFAKEKLGLDQAVGEIDPEILNVNGGAIALGHPVGATGARLVITLMREMQLRKVRYGMASLCIGGGQGGAVILENEESVA